jgi:hypothetical protein
MQMNFLLTRDSLFLCVGVCICGVSRGLGRVVAFFLDRGLFPEPLFIYAELGRI